MKIRSVKANYILNIIRAFSYALITILTMPYINKTLGPVNIGKVEFANTVINYFILLSGLGINIYGIREIARVRDSKKRRDKTYIRTTIDLINNFSGGLCFTFCNNISIRFFFLVISIY